MVVSLPDWSRFSRMISAPFSLKSLATFDVVGDESIMVDPNLPRRFH